MSFSKIVILLLCIIFSLSANAQVEQVILEKYYVSDSLDATDTIGGGIEPGTVTYRIYVDLAQGSRLKSIYGDANHPLEFNSTADFFNNKADGQTFGYNFSTSRLGENTVALDSWLTLGQVTKKTSRTNFGVLKSNDFNGSIIGGANNDGGSALIASGLLVNQDSSAGVPLTVADGMDTMSTVPTSWSQSGFIDLSGNDSTVFGSIVSGNSFSSNGAFLTINDTVGVMGKNPVTNQVIVAQLSTKGELSFRLNLLVEEPSVGGLRLVKYVSKLAAGESNSDSLKVSPYLTYPQLCGCTDPHYIEYSSSYACSNQDSCHRLVVFGCMDTSACNYDPAVNFNLPSLCCYPGYCNDRNLTVVCPQLNFGKSAFNALSIFPNPATEQVVVQWMDAAGGAYTVKVYALTGNVVFEAPFDVAADAGRIIIPVKEFTSGIYMLSLIGSGSVVNKLFVKE